MEFFEADIEKVAKKIDFEKLYKSIYVEEEYMPHQMIEMCQATIFLLDIKNKLNPVVMSSIGALLGVLLGCDEHRKELTKLELLYLVYRCQKELNRCFEDSEHKHKHSLYI